MFLCLSLWWLLLDKVFSCMSSLYCRLWFIQYPNPFTRDTVMFVCWWKNPNIMLIITAFKQQQQGFCSRHVAILCCLVETTLCPSCQTCFFIHFETFFFYFNRWEVYFWLMSLKMSPMVGQQVTERSCVLAVQNFKNMRGATLVLHIRDRLLVLEL